MRVYRPLGGLGSDHRHTKPRRWRGLFWLVLLGAVVLGFVLANESDDAPQQVPRRVEEIEPPEWQEDRLNDSQRGLFKDDTIGLTDVDELEENDDDPLFVQGRLERNQTVFHALVGRGMEREKVTPMVAAMAKVFNFQRAQVGDQFECRRDLDGNILEFRYQSSPEDIYVTRLVGDQYVAEKINIPKSMRVELIEGELKQSLFQAVTEKGEESQLARRFMDLFLFDFDFGTDSQPGDGFKMLVEKIYLEDRFYKYGHILAASYQSGDQIFTAYYFDAKPDDEEPGDYYDPEGRSLRRLFLKSPVKGARLTSGFSLKRYHPVLKRYRPHYGVDYGAPTGTPIMAIGDGEVTFVGGDRKRGYGKRVELRHEQGYSSLYAHMSAFRRRLKVGDKVKQKDIIGYIGSTGVSTGPHLHLGMRKNGAWVDPQAIKSERGAALRGRALKAFKAEYQTLLARLQPPTAAPPKATPAAPPKQPKPSAKGGAPASQP